MPTKPITKRSISDEAVRAKTGKVWDEWFAILDPADATKILHKDIVVLLHEQHGVPDWWAQSVTVEYERARGMREMHEKVGGYAVSANKTINAPVEKLYHAFHDARARKKWLPDARMKITTATKNKSLRIQWGDGTRVSVNLYPKGDSKAQVAVQHEQLVHTKDAAKMKTYWGEAVARLKAMLEAP